MGGMNDGGAVGTDEGSLGDAGRMARRCLDSPCAPNAVAIAVLAFADDASIRDTASRTGHGRCCTVPAPAVKIAVSASVIVQLGDRGPSDVVGTRRIRRMRSTSDPPVAAIAIAAGAERHSSSAASACA